MTKLLTSETKIGLTVSQIITLLGVVAIVVMFYANLTVKINAIEQKNVDLESRINKTEKNMDIIRTENREDHQKIAEKVDIILLKLTK